MYAESPRTTVTMTDEAWQTWRYLRVGLVISPGKENLAGGSKASQVVHMARSVVVSKEADGQPDDLGHTKALLEVVLNLFLAQLGVAGSVCLVHQALLRRDECAAPTNEKHHISNISSQSAQMCRCCTQRLTLMDTGK